jgi:3-hydroxybutyryl-CoA dehydrogenase
VTALHAQIPVVIHDPSPSVLSSALMRFDSSLSKDVSRGRISRESADQARGLITGVKGDGTDGEIMPSDTDLVIEVN